MKATEDGEEEARENRQRNGQERRDYPVDPDPGNLKKSVTPYPHSVTAAH